MPGHRWGIPAVCLLLLGVSAWAQDEATGAGEPVLAVHQRLLWQIVDTQRAVENVAVTLDRSIADRRPVALSALRGDLASLDKHLERLQRRLVEAEVEVEKEQPAAAGDVP